MSLSPTGDPCVSLTNRRPMCLSHQQATHVSLSPTGDPCVSLTNRRPTCLSHQQVTHVSLSPTGDPRVSLTNRRPMCLSHQQATHVSLSPMSLTGCKTPISLFTVIIETNEVVGRMAASRSLSRKDKRKEKTRALIKT